MDVDFDKKILTIGIRDFVEFGQTSYPGGQSSGFGPWRMQLGQQWHDKLGHDLMHEYGEQASLEVSIQGALTFEDWTFQLSGRIDQVVEEDSAIQLREIKTTQQVLPKPAQDLWQMFPDYFEQLACYEILWARNTATTERGIESEIVFLHIDTGIVQSVMLPDSPEATLRRRLECWVDFLTNAAKSSNRIGAFIVPAAFDQFRDEQVPVRNQLFSLLNTEPAKAPSRILAMEAPTGFGKTSLVIEWALQALKQRQVRRVVYLSGKNTGQVQVCKELSRFQEKEPGLRYLPVRNAQTHHQCCPHVSCPCRVHEAENHELRSFLMSSHANALFEQGSGTIDLEAIRDCASSQPMCPRIVSQHCLSHSEFWVGDYNYAFASGAGALLEAVQGFKPAETLLIIDEAHNLHERIASNFSAQIRWFELERLLSELSATRGTQGLQASIAQLIAFVRKLEACEVLPMTDEYQLKDLFESLQRSMPEAIPALKDLTEASIDYLWELLEASSLIEKKDLRLLLWVGNSGGLNLSCIDASKRIAEVLSAYQSVLAMSATLPPESTLASQWGTPTDSIKFIKAQSLWRNEAYSVAVDTRINTSFKQRNRHHHTTADTIARLCMDSFQPVLVFFPSYKYVETIQEYLNVVAPALRVFAMPRGVESGQQLLEIEKNLCGSDALLLPLGSGLSEGIDLLGGQVDRIMIVGPALPEVNPIQKAKSAAYSQRSDAFREVYLIPGITKVNQALGRIVRDPSHRAKVLLHCQRFAEKDYRGLLAPEYQDFDVIRNPDELEHWLVQPA